MTVERYETAEEMKSVWWVLLLLGVVSLGIGAALIFWPGKTLTVVTTIVGIFMIIAGLVRFGVAIFDSHAQERWLMAIFGIIGVVLGVIIIRNPETTIKVIVLITAIFWLIGGMVDFFRGVTNADLPDRGLRIAMGAMSAIFGVVVLVWPEITVGIFAVLMGIYVAFFG
ncbi:MAG: HdeD family acid-resistance protein, partial [Acidimicrobiia bacterium]